MAHESGMERKIDKLIWYVAAKYFLSLSTSSGNSESTKF